ncbi:alkaline phosphatase [Puniceibacterium sediminis]|uniref:Alkaline phosphatase n=1 Tax=Puniceibacterium sediminis TaxID=1608407 RepID=A0A238YYF4_9RHOB|nr:alkaline phosphatase [Puniceibacterium sediminis]SNR76097.1 alkaline phosphatase [Puniceibacterium sediminis]
MTRTLLAGVAAIALAAPAFAQTTIAQADDPWFTAAQEVIAAHMANQPNTNRAKNVILFTGDGNGVGTNYAIRLFEGQLNGGTGDDFVQPHEAFPNSALVKTYTTNGQTPDSAPTASAMNTGVKSKNTMINVSDAVAVNDCAGMKGHELTTFAEIVSGMGKSVGVISTARLTHATPAAVYSKTVNRNWEDNTAVPEDCTNQEDIAAQLIAAMKAGTIDVAMGGGRRHFIGTDVTDAEGKTGKRTDGRNLVEEAQAMGAQYAQTEEEFLALTTAGSNAPILGLFEPSHMMYEQDRTGEPSLAEMTEAAIKTLSSNENGFYMSVEAGRIDHANHDGNLHRTLTDGVAFNAAIRKAMEMTNPEDTLIIVTADHEHAIAFNGYCGRGSHITGLCMDINDNGMMNTGEPLLGADGKPYTVAGYLNGVGSVLTEQADGTYAGSRPDVTDEEAMDADYIQQALIPTSSETHSGEDVAVFAQGPWAHLFNGVIEQNVIFHVMNQAVTAE